MRDSKNIEFENVDLVGEVKLILPVQTFIKIYGLLTEEKMFYELQSIAKDFNR